MVSKHTFAEKEVYRVFNVQLQLPESILDIPCPWSQNDAWDTS